MFASDFYKAIKQQTTDAAELDARDWHVPHKAMIVELAELGTQPATKAVADRIDWIENELEGYRDDVIHDLACAYEAEGDDDAWENARRETPCLISLVEAYFEECAA